MPPDHFLGLCAIAKDETPFLREWVAYHQYIGFEKIYIYDNQSKVPVRDTLEGFFAAETVEVYRVRDVELHSPQLTAYHHCLREHGPEFVWMAFFDLDEFLCLKRDRDARTLMLDYEAYSALSINWDQFGSSGFLGRPSGLVTLNYRQSIGYTVNCKCIVRPERVKIIISPHHFLFHKGIAVNSNHEPALGAYAPLAVDRVCLNHYWVRSQQDYEDKIRRGNPYAPSSARTMEAFYRQAAQAVEEKSDILPLAEEVEQILGERPEGGRYDISFAAVARLPLSMLVKNVIRMIVENKPDRAELVFALGQPLWKDEPAFLDAGIFLFRQTGQRGRAVALARKRVALRPDQDGYLMLLQCLSEDGQREDAGRIAAFLTDFANLDGKPEYWDKVRRYLREYQNSAEEERIHALSAESGKHPGGDL